MHIPQQNLRTVLAIAIFVAGFWISLRTLLRSQSPPRSITGSVLFGLHLLNVFVMVLWFAYIFIGALGQKL